jgi:hypothetical protein
MRKRARQTRHAGTGPVGTKENAPPPFSVDRDPNDHIQALYVSAAGSRGREGGYYGGMCF